jgi:hypothetical protein
MRRFTYRAFVFLVGSSLAVYPSVCSVSSQGQPSSSLLQQDQRSSSDSNFAKLKLPLGVSVEVPKNWWIFDSDSNSTIETFAEATMNLSGIEIPKGKQITLFRANSMPRTTYAGIAIKLRESELDARILKNVSIEEINQFSSDIKQMTQEALSAADLELIEFYGMRREFVGSHPALVIEYKRSGQKGAVIVQITRLFLRGKEIVLDLSYRESEAKIWKPIVLYIRKSLTVT